MQNKIRNLIDKFCDINGESVDCITEFHHFNRKLIEENKEEIIAFYKDNYDCNNPNVNLNFYIKNKNGEELFTFNSLQDLEYFEKFIGILILSGIIYYPLSARCEEEVFLLQTHVIIFPEKNINYQNGLYNEYINEIKNSVFPIFRYQVNTKLLNQNNEQELSDSYILNYWFSKTNTVLTEEDKVKINNAIKINHKMLTFVIAIAHYKALSESVDENKVREDLIKIILKDQIEEYLNYVANLLIFILRKQEVEQFATNFIDEMKQEIMARKKHL